MQTRAEELRAQILELVAEYHTAAFPAASLCLAKPPFPFLAAFLMPPNFSTSSTLLWISG